MGIDDVGDEEIGSDVVLLSVFKLSPRVNWEILS